MQIDRRHFLSRLVAATTVCQTAPLLAAPALARPANARYSIYDFPGGQALRGKAEATSDFSAVTSEAVASGSPIAFPPGRYPFRSFTAKRRCVSLVSDAPVDIVNESGVTFVAGNELSGSLGSVLGFRNVNEPLPGTATTFQFRNGHFDGSELTSSGDHGLGMLDISQYADPLVEGVTGYGGATELSAGRAGAGWTDTMITTHNCFRERIIDLKGSGFFDTLLYLSGDNNGDQIDGRGEQAFVTGLKATRCGNAVVMKRDHVGQVIQNFTISECINGIIGSRADGNPSNQGKRTHVLNGSLRQIQGRPVSIYGTDVLAANLTIEDFGLRLADHRSLTGTRTGNEVAGISIRGGKGGRVSNNTITLRLWLGDDGPLARRRYGIALRRDADDQPTKGCTITGNRIEGFARPIQIAPGCEDNQVATLNKRP